MNRNRITVIFQTALDKVLEYLYPLNCRYLTSAFILLIAFILIIFNNFGSTKFLPDYIIAKIELIIICVIYLLLPSVFFSLILRTQFINIIINIREYFKAIKEYGTLHN